MLKRMMADQAEDDPELYGLRRSDRPRKACGSSRTDPGHLWQTVARDEDDEDYSESPIKRCEPPVLAFD